ncbi:Ankyrin repeat-containing protein [Mucuna pruriens]|uniref:Ankyrin repeat-containing protein n=1 Tax=Mucuna pruriens TaxID=157652 RepID=A0A371H3Y7_MUCPR|nr:Ankyrin repeat-containing protein [Mucuna pruriens]
MSNIITEGHSILRPPYLDGTNCTDQWKERMRIFIQSVDFKLWLVIKNGPKIPTKIIGNEEVEKSEDEYNEGDMKNLELEAKAKNILYCAMNPDAFEKFSQGQTAKQIWDELNRVTTTPQPQLSNSSTTSDGHQYNSPDLYFLQETSTISFVLGESTDKFLELCVPLHKHALEGNWAAARDILEKDSRLKDAAIASGWPTLLHIAAGTNHVSFVEELLKMLTNEQIALQDMKGNTAFCFAVASGNMHIVQLLMKRNPFLPTIRGGGDHTPIHFAVMQGKFDMAQFLYTETKEIFEHQDRKSLFFISIKTGNYDLALQMADEWNDLAYARDLNNDTALHLLAKIQIPLDSCHPCTELENPFNPELRDSSVLFTRIKHGICQLVNFLWKSILSQKNLSEAIKIISEPYQVLFDAAEVGNFGFLSKLISAHPSLIWEVDDQGLSIIHTAVSYRHASIFNLIYEIGSSHKDIIIKYFVEEKNNTLLHLAARLAPPGQLELVSGAAFQMCHELIWFEEVKKIMPPSYIISKNSDGLTAQELFTKEHKGLRKEAEDWMKRTAEYCMIISTVIATGVFAAAINIPGGIDDETKKPNYLSKTPFLVFAISDAAAFVSSATAILIFLSILISRYAEYDFHKSLPLKLISGLITLFISISCMMVAFGSAFFITYNYGLKVVPDLISTVAILPMVLYVALQISLWKAIIHSTFYCRTLFKPSKRMIY